MGPLKKRWKIDRTISPEANLALQEYPPILRQILYNRGYVTQALASQYLEARQPPGTDPFEMGGMQAAVDRLQYAIQHKESLAVYGDYDADGVTATALLMEVLQKLGAQVQGYIPNRFDEGYGLNIEALDNLREAGVRLVITVDCGIRSPIEAQHAREIGMDLIISDHHHPDKNLPQALAVINPKQQGDPYPEKELAGVGLAYKLAAGLIQETGVGNGGFIPNAEDYLDLVALGTVADLAPLKGENRSLVRRGLERIRRPRRQGLMALIGVSGLHSERVTATDIGFALGPRLNAAGRLESALNALTLLTTSNVHEAAKLAQLLEIQNRERQQITRDIQAQAELIALADNPDALLLFAAHPDFNPGVVGLAASRLTDIYYRPSIVAQYGEEFTRGSCRSIAEFHITQALDQCADLLEHHGGHAAAAGFTVRNEKLPELIERLQGIAAEQLSEMDLRPTLNADLELPLSDLRPEILEYLDWLQPTGYGNHQAYFISRDLRVVKSQTVGKDNSHLRLTVTDGWITYNAIAFRQGYWQEQMPAKIDILYTFELNEYNNRKYLQLNVRDIKIAGED